MRALIADRDAWSCRIWKLANGSLSQVSVHSAGPILCKGQQKRSQSKQKQNKTNLVAKWDGGDTFK